MNIKIQKRRRKVIVPLRRKLKFLDKIYWASLFLVLLPLFLFWHPWFFPRISSSSSGRSYDGTENSSLNIITYQKPSQSFIWIAGLALDKDDIKVTVADTLVELNCLHNVGIHILLKSEHQIIPFQRDWRQKQSLFLKDITNESETDGSSCGPVLIQDQNSLINDTVEKMSWHSYNTTANRIDKISALRDVQRSTLYKKITIGKVQKHYSSYSDPILEGVVIIADLDLHKIPDAAQIMEQVHSLQDPQYPFDAVCTAGITMNIGRMPKNDGTSNKLSIYESWYYDTFATVFLPDTFSHPIKRRLIPYMYKGENPKFIRSNNQYGNFTQGDIFQYFVNANQGEPVGVKSCFGGITIYRASVYFDERCKYCLDKIAVQKFQHYFQKQPQQEYFRQGLHQGDIFRYASNKEQRPCEHVVFHDCLKRVSGGKFRLAVNPALKTYWKRDF
jgi:hypothetical protein